MPTEQDVIERLKSVIDPHVGVDVYTMGLIQDIKVEEDKVEVTFVPSSPFCPLGIELARMIKNALDGIEGVRTVVTVRGHVKEEDINKALNEC